MFQAECRRLASDLAYLSLLLAAELPAIFSQAVTSYATKIQKIVRQ
jgi:hypothetical protein